MAAIWLRTAQLHRDEVLFPSFHSGDLDKSLCGQRFAQMEMRLTLGSLLPLFRFYASDATEELPIKIKKWGLCEPINPLKIAVQRR